MLIEQIIEFEVRGPGPPGRTCTSTAGNFYDKTKTSLEYLRVDYYLVLNYCRMHHRPTLLLPTLAESVAKFNPKCKIFKRVLD